MAVYAYTDIDAAFVGKDDKVVKMKFAAGDEVEGLPRDIMVELAEAGAIAKYNRLEVEAGGSGSTVAAETLSAENAELRDRIKELEASVAAKTEGGTAMSPKVQAEVPKA